MLQTIFPLVFSASMLQDVHKCQMAFFRQHIQCLTGFTQNPHLQAGGLIANACEITRKAFFTDGLPREEAIQLGVELILSAPDTGSNVKSNENVAYCFTKYFKKFPLDREGEQLPAAALADGTHAVEYAFEFDLNLPHPDFPDKSITFVGHLDYIGERSAGNKITRHGVDEKTCSSIFRMPGSSEIDYRKETDRYRTNTQILSYNWAARELGFPLESFLIRRIPLMSNFEEAYELEVFVTEFEINSWYIATLETIKELIEKYKIYKQFIEGNASRFPYEIFIPVHQEYACTLYGNTCKYMDGCLYKEGEDLLIERFPQKLYDRVKREDVLLEDYLKNLRG
jgi:hypothetical protein